jgi:hypothetical protein
MNRRRLFIVGAGRVDDLLRVAREIWQRERRQAEAIKSGHSLREQLEFAPVPGETSDRSGYTFREHLRKISRLRWTSDWLTVANSAWECRVQIVAYLGSWN